MSVFVAGLLLLLAAEPVPNRDAAIAEIERISLDGGRESFHEIVGFLAKWSGDKSMERHGVAALRRVSVPAMDVAEIIANDPDPVKRAWAAWLAGEQRLEPAAEALIAALKDADPKVRFRAAVSLGLVADPRASDPLLKAAVHDKDPAVRDAAEKSQAAVTSARADGSPVEPVLARLELEDTFARLEAVRELEKRKDRRAVGPLLTLLTTERDLGVRKAAVTALAAIGDPLAVPALVEIARQDGGDVRPFAVGALATLDDDRAVAPLVELTKDPDERVRRYAVRAIAFMERPGAAGVLIGALSDMVSDVRLEAAKGLTKLSPSGVPRELADALADRVAIEPSGGVRLLLIGVLAEVGSVKHEKAVIGALEDENPEVRLVAAAALGRIGGPAAEKALRKVADKEAKKKQEDRDAELIKIANESADRARGRTR